MKDDWVVDLSPFIENPKTRAEYGSHGNIGFADCKMYDESGEEIPIERCKTCNAAMTMVIGVRALAWYCYEHGFNQTKEQNEN